MVKNSVDIESAFRPLNALSKILGLAHFSGHKNSFTTKITSEGNRESEFAYVICCVAVICTIVTGFVYSIIMLNFTLYPSVFIIVLFIFSITMVYLGTLLALIAGLTWNRKEFPENVLKISLFEEHMFGAKRAVVWGLNINIIVLEFGWELGLD